MTRLPFTFTKAVPLVLMLGMAVSTATSAYALPHFGLHRHPANDTRVRIVIHNTGAMFRDVKIDGQLYTVQPHQYIGVKAPEGTPVYTDSTGSLHHKGDLLFAVTREMDNSTIAIK